jgi:hypothetical protein
MKYLAFVKAPPALPTALKVTTMDISGTESTDQDSDDDDDDDDDYDDDDDDDERTRSSQNNQKLSGITKKDKLPMKKYCFTDSKTVFDKRFM